MSYGQSLVNALCLVPQSHRVSSIFLLDEMLQQNHNFTEFNAYRLNVKELDLLSNAMLRMHAKYYIKVGYIGKDNSKIQDRSDWSFWKKVFTRGLTLVGENKLHSVFERATEATFDIAKDLYVLFEPEAIKETKRVEDGEIFSRGYTNFVSTANILDSLGDKVPLSVIINSHKEVIKSKHFLDLAKKYRNTFTTKNIYARRSYMSHMSGLLDDIILDNNFRATYVSNKLKFIQSSSS